MSTLHLLLVALACAAGFFGGLWILESAGRGKAFDALIGTLVVACCFGYLGFFGAALWSIRPASKHPTVEQRLERIERHLGISEEDGR
jgi:hypothetical protein